MLNRFLSAIALCLSRSVALEITENQEGNPKSQINTQKSLVLVLQTTAEKQITKD